ncbi:hypothetical protein [Lacticaseibacillus suihuaensis]
MSNVDSLQAVHNYYLKKYTALGLPPLEASETEWAALAAMHRAGWKLPQRLPSPEALALAALLAPSAGAAAATGATPVATAGTPSDPATGSRADPTAGTPTSPTTGAFVIRATGSSFDPVAGSSSRPAAGLLSDPATGSPSDPTAPVPELDQRLRDFGLWLRDEPMAWGWYEDSPLTDEELATAENRAAWREFQAGAQAEAQALCDTIFGGPGLVALAPDAFEHGDVPRESVWPLLDVLVCLRKNGVAYRFVPEDAMAPQRAGRLEVAGLTLDYELPDWATGLPWVTLDYAAYALD